MAGREPSISRRRILGAAAALPLAALPAPGAEAVRASADRGLWETRLARYRVLAERTRAAAETGWFRAANDRYYAKCAAIAARFGGEEAAAASEEAGALRRAAFRRVDRAEDLYWRRCTAPTQEAAIALAFTRAPDIAAVRTKIAVLRAHDLDEPDAMRRNALEVVDRDLASLIQFPSAT